MYIWQLFVCEESVARQLFCFHMVEKSLDTQPRYGQVENLDRYDKKQGKPKWQQGRH